MAFGIGTRIGSHEITALLGKGGMGEVYRARDLKLKREVAIKVLPEEFSRDVDRLARFQREAELLASLNHPNIAAIYDFEEAGGTRFLVLELVEGETLAERIARGRIPLEEVLDIAKGICDALEAAHEKGIVHRDLKPANVKIMPDGRVKVLDFGLAKALEATSENPALSNSPTLVSGTLAGMILGTAGYMSPEQARGRTADQRSDVFAFGCVLYEMLTGQAAFSGETVMDTLGAVMKVEPDWSALLSATPSHIRKLLGRCLQKDRRLRLRAIGDARLELEEPANADSGSASQTSYRYRNSSILVAFGFVLAAAAAIALYIQITRGVQQVPPAVRAEIAPPPGTNFNSFAISPDGRKLVFAAGSGTQTRLWLRDLDSTVAQPINGTDGAVIPFWWPDSRSIGFFSTQGGNRTGQQLKRLELASRAITIVAEAGVAGAAAVNVDGGIWVNSNRIIQQISGAGTPSPNRFGEGFSGPPVFLQDGHHFLIYRSSSLMANASSQRPGVFLASMDSGETRFLLDADGPPTLLPPDHLLFVRQNGLFAQRFDAKKFELNDDPVQIASPVSDVSTSTTGIIAFRAGDAFKATNDDLRQLAWFDRSGALVENVGKPARTNDIELSPDGKWVSMGLRPDNTPQDIWLLELARAAFTRFTFGPSNNVQAIWSPDGKRIAYSKGQKDLYTKSLDSGGREELVLEADKNSKNGNPQDWSRDNKFMLFTANSGTDLWALPLTGDNKPFPVANTAFTERDGQFAPDSQWVAYSSNESGRVEIYVQQFPGPGMKRQVSTAGGAHPRWRKDGKELFYIAADGQLMATPIVLPNKDQSIEIGSPVPLFATHLFQAGRQNYLPSADGQRFLMVMANENNSPITIILNWHPERGK